MELYARKVECLFLRLILHICINQQCEVKWCNKCSNFFTVQNRVRQGDVSSGTFFAIYVDKLFVLLRKTGVGCHINGAFCGTMIFADDTFLLSASRNGLQVVDICAKLLYVRNLKFGTNTDPIKSKTKSIMFTKKLKPNCEPLNITLNGNQLPWVRQVNHLGHILQSDNSMTLDIAQKRGIFIAKVNSLLQEFYFVTPDVLIKLMRTYAFSIYGSNTWDIYSKGCEKLHTSFNVAIRQMLSIDRCTHRYMIESLSECLHLKTELASRYVSFYRSLQCSKKFPVRFLARLCENDQRTCLGRTLARLAADTGLRMDELSKLTANLVKRKLPYWPLPDAEKWRIPLCKELLALRADELFLDGFSADEREEILKYACIS